MAHSLVWADFTPKQIEFLEQNAYGPEGKKALSEYLNVADTSTNPHSRILLSLYHSALLFAKKNFQTLEKMAAFISIVKLVHFKNITVPFINLEDSFAFFKKLLVEHSVHRPPYSIQIFSLEEVSLITDYMVETYYRHFKLYKYAFTKKQLLDVKVKEMTIDHAPIIPPLSTATKVDPLTITQGNPDGDQPGVVGDGNAEKEGENKDGSRAASKLSMRSSSPTAIDRNPSSTPDPLRPGSTAAASATLPARELNEVEQVAVSVVQERLEILKAEISNQIKESEKVLSEKILDIESRVDGKRPKSPKAKPVKK